MQQLDSPPLGDVTCDIQALSSYHYDTLLSSRDPITQLHPGATLMCGLLPRVNSIRNAVARLFKTQNIAERIESVTLHITALENLDRDLETWEDELPEDWRYITTVNTSQRSNDVILATLIILPNINIAGPWIAYWLARLSVLHSIITLVSLQQQLQDVTSSSAETLCDNLWTVTRYITSTMCSTVPFLLGQAKTYQADPAACSSGRTPRGAGIGAVFATRALFVSAQVDGIPDSLFKWALDTLQFIGAEYGIKQALVLREALLLPCHDS